MLKERLLATAVMVLIGCAESSVRDADGSLALGLTFDDGTTAPKLCTIPPDPDDIILEVSGSGLPVDGAGVSLEGITAPLQVIHAGNDSTILQADLSALPADGAADGVYDVTVRVGSATTNTLSLTVHRDFEIAGFTFGDGTTAPKTRTLPSTAGVHFKVQGQHLPFDRPSAYELVGAPAAATLDATQSSDSQLVFNVPLDGASAGQYSVSARVYNRSTPQLTLDLATYDGGTPYDGGTTTNCDVKAYIDNNHFTVLAVSGLTITANVTFQNCPGRSGEIRRQGVSGLKEFVGDVVTLSGNQVTFNPGTLPASCLPVVGEDLYLLWM